MRSEPVSTACGTRRPGRSRGGNSQEAAPAAEEDEQLVVPELPPVASEPAAPVRVDGYVSRSGGPQTVWVNGTDSYQGNLGEHGIDPARVRVESRQVRVPLASSPQDVLLKPGQIFQPETSQVIDTYEALTPETDFTLPD